VCTIGFTAINAGTDGTIKAVETVESLPNQNLLEFEMYQEAELPEAFFEGARIQD
jgi:hypothetical protein